MNWNAQLFLLLDAPAAPAPWSVLIARLLAETPILVAALALMWLWVRHTDARRAGLLATACALLLGQWINMLLGRLWFEPRPFMLGFGHTLLAHPPDNGFPSDHSTLMFAMASGLILTGASRMAGSVIVLFGIGVAWSRIYLGVHYPIDVLAGAVVGVSVGLTARLMLPVLSHYALPPASALYDRAVVILGLPLSVFPRAQVQCCDRLKFVSGHRRQGRPTKSLLAGRRP